MALERAFLATLLLSSCAPEKRLAFGSLPPWGRILTRKGADLPQAVRTFSHILERADSSGVSEKWCRPTNDSAAKASKKGVSAHNPP